jgi:hypothetical protein
MMKKGTNKWTVLLLFFCLLGNQNFGGNNVKFIKNQNLSPPHYSAKLILQADNI